VTDTSRLSLSALPAGLGVSSRGSLRFWRASSWRELIVALVAVVGAALAVVVTARAHFLAHPGWLAVQKADIVLGPIGVGLYWRRRRPGSQFGPLLIALGFVGLPYILQSSTSPGLFGTGVAWELVIFLATLALILAFPSGRLDGLAERLILAAAALTVVLPGLAIQLISPHLGPDGSISGCWAMCPRNGLAIASHPALALGLVDFRRGAIIAIALATTCLIVWRFATGTPPRRRALAIGAPLAMLFLLMQATYQALKLFAPNAAAAHNVIQWTFAGARSLLWCGWLFALIAAELFAARVLRRIIGESLRRPPLRELEAMLRAALGDPGLRLVFWRDGTAGWADAGGAMVERPHPSSGRAITEFELDGQPAAAILHDPQLDEDPELLQAAGAVALLARENADLAAAWNESVRELADSRARIAAASDSERRKLERDLHDGAQQRLLAVLLKLDLARELVPDRPDVRRRLSELGRELEDAIDELRALGHGIYPTLLANSGLATALHALAGRSAGRITFTDAHVGELPTEIEAALYYCCLEAVQNATKHAGPQTEISISLLPEARGELALEVRDNGCGFELAGANGGVGLRNMRDRLGAVRGRLEITSELGRGTVVAAAVPITR
jgi:signal transduction histidine kinase